MTGNDYIDSVAAEVKRLLDGLAANADAVAAAAAFDEIGAALIDGMEAARQRAVLQAILKEV